MGNTIVIEGLNGSGKTTMLKNFGLQGISTTDEIPNQFAESNMEFILNQFPSQVRPRFGLEWFFNQELERLKLSQAQTGLVMFGKSIYSLIAYTYANDALRQRSELPYLFSRISDYHSAEINLLRPMVYLDASPAFAVEQVWKRDSPGDREKILRKQKTDVEKYYSIISEAYKTIITVLKDDALVIEVPKNWDNRQQQVLDWANTKESLVYGDLSAIMKAFGVPEYSSRNAFCFESDDHLTAAIGAQLLSKYKIHEDAVANAVKEFKSSGKLYSLKTVDSDLSLRLNRHSSGGLHYSIGSFPIKQFHDALSVDPNVDVSILIDREKIRKRQKQELVQKSGQINIVSKEELQRIISHDFSSATKMTYVDPYHFIGDSIIGLFFPDSMQKNFPDISQVEVYSKASNHMQTFCNSAPYNIDAIAKSITTTTHCILPDLLENNWQDTMRIINAVSLDRFHIVLLGRNMYVRNNGNGIETFGVTNDDVLLKDANIQDYMEQALVPFIPRVASDCAYLERVPNAFWLNPFGSRPEKTMPLEFAVTIANNIYTNNYGMIHIMGGFNNNDDHNKWVAEFTRMMDALTVPSNAYRIIHYPNLSLFAKDLSNSNSFVVSTDTSIIHIANRCGTPNIATFNSCLWDNESVLSMTLDSPLGFNRHYIHTLPCVLDTFSPDQVLRSADYASDAIRFFLQQSTEKMKILSSYFANKNNKKMAKDSTDIKAAHDTTAWITGLYDFDLLIHNIKTNPSSSHLCDAAIKISPLTKMGRYHHDK